jgi:Phage integrase family
MLGLILKKALFDGFFYAVNVGDQIARFRTLDERMIFSANLFMERPYESGQGSNVYSRYFLPAIEKAGLRHFRIHDLRHTYASLLIQSGASLAYVRDQLGHSSIQVTVDLYGHLVPSANVGWVDGLDSKEPEQQSATPAQQEAAEENDDGSEVIENYGGPGVSRTRDLRFRKPLLYPSELRGLVALL